MEFKRADSLIPRYTNSVVRDLNLAGRRDKKRDGTGTEGRDHVEGKKKKDEQVIQIAIWSCKFQSLTKFRRIGKSTTDKRSCF